MNEAIKEEIASQYNLIMEKWFNGLYLSDKQLFVDKVTLYKNYIEYPEEFLTVLDKGGHCYLGGLKISCPPVPTCEACYKTKTTQYLLTKINHVP